MYLKEIVISGFKSFAERTRLDLQRGMTAVVGPNGCGKSNIVDAIRWVLGEQSAKALRGGSMQDVIFEGTDQRKPLPVCEVSLTFADCEEAMGTRFSEVEISRRVTRDGGSEYGINGKPARLKDIQRLFANTGVGRVSYSFMLQGQIDQILSTNPAERRVIFEEAAGITLYKSQRKEALNKLALVDANLARVTDVIEEVSRQIGSVKRQAGKALRYKRLRHRLTHLELAFNAHRYADLKASVDGLSERGDELRRKAESHRESLEADEKALESKKAERAELAESMQQQQQRVYSLRSDKDNAANQAEFAEVRANDLEKRIGEYEDEIANLEERQRELAEKARNASENKQMQLGVVDDSDRVFRERNDELVQAQEALGKEESRLQEQRQAVLHAENRINRARSRSTTLEVDLKSYQVKRSSLQEAIANHKREAEDLENGLAEIRRLLETKRAEQSEAQAALDKAREDSAALLKEFRGRQETIQEQDREIARKTAHLNVLENLEAKFEGLGEGAKAILGNKLGDVIEPGQATVLSGQLKVDAAYAKALELLLGPAAEALFVGAGERALRVLERLEAEQLGRACLQTERAAPAGGNGEALPEWLVPARSVVEVADPALAGTVDGLLRGCYFVERMEDFYEFWRGRPDFDFQRVATPGGALADRNGLMQGGRSSGKQDTSVLERQAEIRRLRKEIENERRQLAERREAASALDERRNEAEAAVEEQRKRLSDLGGEVSGLEAEERNQLQKQERNEEARKKSESELEELDGHHAEAAKEMETAKSELAEAEQALENERAKSREIEEAIERARETRDAKREALSDVRLELAEKKQRLETVDRTLGEVERETADIRERIQNRRQEIDTLREQIDELKEKRKTERAKADEIETTLGVATERLEKDRERLKEMDASISEIDGGLSWRRSETRNLEQELNKLEVRLAEERSQLGFIEQSVNEDYQVALSEVDWRRELWVANIELKKRVSSDDLDDPDALSAVPGEETAEPSEEDLAGVEAPDWSEAENEIAELKGRIANMGPVNTDSISEYADLKERHDFLRNQSEDLWNSKNALVQSIDEINATSQQLFKDTFEQVRRNFAFTYDKLSGGGLADLKLVDAEDPLESGIEIIARPPGTRLKSVTLLSGGQRTMAAVALLFAIYLVKPSPFCVLDEIDAALDDANIGRFCETLRGFLDKSQFLIITHNKRTIANADTVFGVTMPEKGVSRMLSMRFNKESDKPELVGS